MVGTEIKVQYLGSNPKWSAHKDSLSQLTRVPDLMIGGIYALVPTDHFQHIVQAGLGRHPIHCQLVAWQVHLHRQEDREHR